MPSKASSYMSTTPLSLQGRLLGREKTGPRSQDPLPPWYVVRACSPGPALWLGSAQGKRHAVRADGTVQRVASLTRYERGAGRSTVLPPHPARRS